MTLISYKSSVRGKASQCLVKSQQMCDISEGGAGCRGAGQWEASWRTRVFRPGTVGIYHSRGHSMPEGAESSLRPTWTETQPPLALLVSSPTGRQSAWKRGYHPVCRKHNKHKCRLGKERVCSLTLVQTLMKLQWEHDLWRSQGLGLWPLIQEGTWRQREAGLTSICPSRCW